VPITRVLALGFPISALGVVPDGMLQREMRFAWLAVSDVISYALGYGAVGVTLALLGAGAWSLVLASLAQTVALTVILLLASPHPLRPLLDRRAARELLDYGGGYTLARAFNYVALNGDNVVVGRFLGVAALGIYSRSFQLLTLPVNVVANVVEQVLFPLMARVRHDDRLLRSTFRQAVVLVALLFLPWTALLCIAPP